MNFYLLVLEMMVPKTHTPERKRNAQNICNRSCFVYGQDFKEILQTQFQSKLGTKRRKWSRMDFLQGRLGMG